MEKRSPRYNLTIVFTIHQENGKCNSIELLKVIKKVSPEIIFEELQYSIFDRIYKENKQTTLETNAIKEYIKEHDFMHIPVDTFNRPKAFEEGWDSLLSRITSQASRESFQLRGLLKQQASAENQYGFDFLNSDRNDMLFQEMNLLKESILKSINDENLFRIFTLEKEVIEKRENEMLDNIYSFNKEHQYDQALLFVGSGHRKSMIKKIEHRNKQEIIKINWNIYNK